MDVANTQPQEPSSLPHIWGDVKRWKERGKERKDILWTEVVRSSCWWLRLNSHNLCGMNLHSEVEMEGESNAVKLERGEEEASFQLGILKH